MNGWKPPTPDKRVLVIRFEDGHTEHVPVTNATTFRVGDQMYAVEGIRELDFLTPELADVEAASFGDIDAGTPVSMWGKS